ncbi:hypothetical protein ACJX0J_024788, partial [Zea mays]
MADIFGAWTLIEGLPDYTICFQWLEWKRHTKNSVPKLALSNIIRNREGSNALKQDITSLPTSAYTFQIYKFHYGSLDKHVIGFLAQQLLTESQNRGRKILKAMYHHSRLGIMGAKHIIYLVEYVFETSNINGWFQEAREAMKD